jgi:NAD(P)-dependent dehydrogenase (short-subunit alcohol dehydrogenase family)
MVVMGASSGIGRLTALELARWGAQVVVSAPSDQPLDSLAQEISRAGGQGLALPADTADFDQIQAVATLAARAMTALALTAVSGLVVRRLAV